MKRTVNLLLKQKNYKALEKFFLYFRFITLITVVGMFVSLAVLFLLKSQLKQKYDSALKEKESILQQILVRNDIEEKSIYLNQKGTAFNTYLDNDVNFLPYYKLLQNYLPFSSQSASIEKVDYDNKKNVNIILKFSDYDNFYNALTLLQDRQFLSIFNSLRLEGFSIQEDVTNDYRLNLKGQFKPIQNE